MRLAAAVSGLVLSAILVGSLAIADQPIDPMYPDGEQQIEVLRPGAVQEIERVDRQEQEIGVAEPVSRGKRIASNVGKVVVGVAAVGIAVGAAALSLLLL